MICFYFLILFSPLALSSLARKGVQTSFLHYFSNKEKGIKQKIFNKKDLGYIIYNAFENGTVANVESRLEGKLFDVSLTFLKGFRELLKKEGDLYMVFAKHLLTAPSVKELTKVLAGEIGESLTRLSILGFIERLPTIYEEASNSPSWNGPFAQEDFYL
jgi:hypothetical protein